MYTQPIYIHRAQICNLRVEIWPEARENLSNLLPILKGHLRKDLGHLLHFNSRDIISKSWTSVCQHAIFRKCLRGGVKDAQK